ncbi:hypothetical protein Acy02nite_90890 [Actinoplanes cyaneus]|uniref:Uncharacterized protein n=1 Tax=Actinoplanes cyaneus TaxID=52696 RepID=A0A919ITP9_9ACTN|nr:hypothetical protein [Actinoplanes cyaneus]MCW2144514.1 hypothetical protein [Actinoplanes cyaneus]GID71208.1 hypothetical protein Acy02nite_90890 [Actinoplanes cyaneus]
MAVRGDDTHFEFGGPDVLCLQLLTLRLTFDTGSTLAVTTYQDDDAFGLAIGSSSNGPGEEMGTGYRSRSSPELPAGQIEEAAVYLDGALLAEVTLRVGGQQVVLIAGEADENSPADSYGIASASPYLSSPRPSDARAMSWTPTRTPLGFVTRQYP